MKKVLVAGSTGYLGKFVVKEFKQRGYWIRALARNPQKLEKQGPFLEPAVTEYIDEIFVGEITKPETLDGICRDIDIVFSSIGITRQKDKLTFRDVDYQGNKNLLDIAVTNTIKKFIFVSIFHANRYEYLSVVKAREDFVRDLKNSHLDYVVIRPTGYFSDMGEFFKMAKSGRVYIVGDGENKMNPIHGADLAKVCVDSVELGKHEIEVGGPEIYTYMEIAELAFSVIGKESKVICIPPWTVKMITKIVRPFSKKYSELLHFFSTAMQHDSIAPAFGHHRLKDYYKELLNIENHNGTHS